MSTLPTTRIAQPVASYRHVPARAVADSRDLKIPRLSIDTGSIPLERLRPVYSGPSPNGSNSLSAKHHNAPHATSNHKQPRSHPSAKGKERAVLSNISINAAGITSNSNDTTSPTSAKVAFKEPHCPQQHHQSLALALITSSTQPDEPYRHIPTHAATDAFLTSAGTRAGRHRERIDRLADHSRRLSLALSNPAVIQAKKQRFGSSSTSGSSAASASSRSSKGSGNGTSSSAASVRSSDAVLCGMCHAKGGEAGMKCWKHARGGRTESSGSGSGSGSGSRSGSGTNSAASSVVLKSESEGEKLGLASAGRAIAVVG